VRQHSIGMEQIVAAMTDISHATTQNLNATSSTQTAAEDLTNLAKRLALVIADYRMGGSIDAPTAANVVAFSPTAEQRAA
jgi:hypothetical protein